MLFFSNILKIIGTNCDFELAKAFDSVLINVKEPIAFPTRQPRLILIILFIANRLFEDTIY